MEFTNLIVPEIINDYRVYDGDGNVVVGITEDMSMAELSSQVATIKGAGILGSYDVPVLGHYESITQEIPFRILYTPVLRFANPMKRVSFNIRGAIQVTDKSTGLSDFAGFRYLVEGRCKSITPGSLKAGEIMGAKISIEAMHIIYEIDGEKLIEIDKQNSVFRIEGVDLMEKVRRFC